jgi:hypothetical protein
MLSHFAVISVLLPVIVMLFTDLQEENPTKPAPKKIVDKIKN